MKAFSVGQDRPWQRVVPFTEGLVKSPTTLNNIDTYCLSNTLTSSDTLVTVFTA
jgi:NADH:ubiquinone oxidoreductase subunit F (NADH-binding)